MASHNGHGHGGPNWGGGHCSCEHDHAEAERGLMYSLYEKIDTPRVVCLNEAVDGSAKTIFKPWDQRLDKTLFIESDTDEELLITVPFTVNVKLKGLIVIGGDEGSHPSVMRLFKNRPGMTFDDSSMAADQTFDMQPDYTGTLEYSTNIARFSSIHTLTIFLSKNYGGNDVPTKVCYIGLRGEFTEAQREGVVIATYEARANPADHAKTSAFDSVPRQIH